MMSDLSPMTSTSEIPQLVPYYHTHSNCVERSPPRSSSMPERYELAYCNARYLTYLTSLQQRHNFYSDHMSSSSTSGDSSTGMVSPNPATLRRPYQRQIPSHSPFHGHRPHIRRSKKVPFTLSTINLNTLINILIACLSEPIYSICTL